MADVFLCRTGQLTAASRRELKRAGVVVVEVEDPSACQFIRATEAVSGDDMLWAACDALKRTYNEGYSDKGGASRVHREKFALNLFELIDAAHSADAPAPKAAPEGER
jgi:hypothetical protein